MRDFLLAEIPPLVFGLSIMFTIVVIGLVVVCLI